ncbi:hypothetical protein ADICYQ_5822 [Cyclobacterium qasimii M12-11B]|uniref:Uncharacterized protein n=1 Tax=Cyclobacterium qasimii M12-11B TaxID=641524 RepID=S7WEV1_9BACT|nr:hypothetical protein ADICYQ_5822 [Cyclobacterium qasimii M12-11B]
MLKVNYLFKNSPPVEESIFNYGIPFATYNYKLVKLLNE